MFFFFQIHIPSRNGACKPEKRISIKKQVKELMLNGGQPRFFRADWISQKTRKGLQKMVDEMKCANTRKQTGIYGKSRKRVNSSK